MINKSDILVDTEAREVIAKFIRNPLINNVYNHFDKGFLVWGDEGSEPTVETVQDTNPEIFYYIDQLIFLSQDKPVDFFIQSGSLVQDFVEFDEHHRTSQGYMININIAAHNVSYCFPSEYVAKLLYLVTLASLGRNNIRYSDVPFTIFNKRNFALNGDKSMNIIRNIYHQYLDLLMQNSLMEKVLASTVIDLKLGGLEDKLIQSN